MIEFIFKPSRMVAGKKLISRTYSGRYALRAGDTVRTICLYTEDKQVALKRLRDMVSMKQAEAEGIIQPELIRSAAGASLVSLVSEYKSDLSGRGLEKRHVKSTVLRIERIVGGAGWLRLADVNPSSFVAWRAKLTCSAKTKKEYQTSINAFLNWLVRMGKLAVNPLAHVDRVDVRGKQVRQSRAYTAAELSALCKVVPADRRLVYLFLTYTGARKSEAKKLRWSDLFMDQESPCVVFRASTTKDKDKRTVPLRAELGEMLRSRLGAESEVVFPERPSGLVFPTFPSWETFLKDLERAGIARKDDDGRVVHFHAFRKTFQTWGAAAGVGQRAAQEMLGHSDPSLTAGVYTDIAGLALTSEVAKLPWVDENYAQLHAQTGTKTCAQTGFRDILTQLQELVQKALSEGDRAEKAALKMVVGDGFEPSEA